MSSLTPPHGDAQEPGEHNTSSAEQIAVDESFTSTLRLVRESNARSARGTDAGLNEFRSLLEAAERIANSASIDLDGAQWSDETASQPIIRRSNDFRSRVPLTRQYSGRPHVPGEDSGSEDEDEEEEPTMESAHEHERDQDDTEHPQESQILGEIYSGPGNATWTFIDEANVVNAHAAQRHSLSRPRTPPRSTTEEQVNSDRETLRRAVSITRDLQRHRRNHESQAEITASLQRNRETQAEITASLQRDRSYATNGPEPVRDSYYDWAPELQRAQDSGEVPESRMRSSSVRRWRPSERLQDYASNHARREGANENSWTSNTDWQSTGTGWTSSVRPASREFGDHNDIVDRVERALQEYRQARRALRPELNAPTSPTSGSNRGLVYRPPYFRGTAQEPDWAATEAHWLSRGDDEVGNPEANARSAMLDRWRRDDTMRQRIREQARERRRRVVNSMLETEGASPIASGPLFDSHRNPPRTAVDTQRINDRTRVLLEKAREAEIRANNQNLKRAKAMLQHLATLRQDDMTEEEAWRHASDLGLHNQSIHEKPDEKLPMSVDDLPEPVYCSWLQPGMTWSGSQCAEDEKDDKEPTRHEPNINDVVRRAHETLDRAQEAVNQNQSVAGARAPLPADQDPLQRALDVARNSMAVLEDAERNLNSMLERTENLLEENGENRARNRELLRQQLRETDERLRSIEVGGHDHSESRLRRPKDQWDVKVNLHSIDWRRMTLTGTMTASHKRNPRDTDRINENPAMDSFFTGEIIDFASHGLDTLSCTERQANADPDDFDQHWQDDWKVGGLETDLSYWAGIGPFKREIDAVFISEADNLCIRSHHTNEELPDPPNHTPQDPPTPADEKYEPRPSPYSTITSLSDSAALENEKFNLKMRTMHHLLSDKNWLNENLNSSGWILMRWKERCFVSPGTEANPEPNRTWIPNSTPVSGVSMTRPMSSHANRRYAQRIWSTNESEREELGGTARAEGRATWGLTISGFYYVALHRQSGRIEALYYDCGSAPYQKLKMGPLTGSLEEMGGKGGENDGGLRTNFNVVEFR